MFCIFTALYRFVRWKNGGVILILILYVYRLVVSIKDYINFVD